MHFKLATGGCIMAKTACNFWAMCMTSREHFCWKNHCWHAEQEDISWGWPPGVHSFQVRFWLTPLYRNFKSFHGYHLATWSSLQRFSIGLRCGHWLAYSITLMGFFFSHVRRPIFRFYATCWSIGPLMRWSCRTLGGKTAPTLDVIPAPCLTVGMELFVS